MNFTMGPALPRLCITLLLAATLSACGGGGGRDPILGFDNTLTPLDTTRPRVELTTPATTVPGPTPSVLVNPAISAVFTESMAPATIGASSFLVSCAAPCVSPAGTVTYVVGSRTAVFTPAAALVAGQTYTATITTQATDLAGNQLAGNQGALPAASNYVWTFATAAPVPVPVPPTITAVAPVNLATGVAINNTLISADFSEPMSPITGAASFVVSCASPCVSPAGTVSLDATNRVATYSLPSGTTLAPMTTYTATVTGARSLASGLAMTGPYVWTFSTGAALDTTRPRVELTTPATTVPGPTAGVPVNTAISAVFTESMAPATIGASSFLVSCAAPCVSPAGTVTYVVGNRTAVFTPAAALVAGQTYTATITTQATDLAGNQLAGNQGALPAASNYVWTFVTAAPVPAANVSVSSTNPAAGANNVCLDATVNASFNVPSGLRMDPAALNGSIFSVTGPGVVPVPASSVVFDIGSGRIATFTPQAPLTAGVTYTATIRGGNTGVRDLAVPANGMVSDFSWNFTAVSCVVPPIPPIVSLGSARTFGSFGGSAGMTNQGINTVINGDIGTTAVSTAVTGFHDAGPGCTYTETPLNIGLVNGMIYTAAPPPTPACPSEGTATTFAVATAARADALVAYNALVAMPGGPDPGAGNLANLVLAPGVYTAAAGTFMIQGGDLTLDAQGNPNASWVFQMAASLTVGGPGAAFPRSVILVNGAQAKNVFWQVGTAAIINAGAGGTFQGTVITQAGAAISTAGAAAITTINGQVLSLGASVTMVNTVINVPAP